MQSVARSIEVDVPMRTAYTYWSQFEQLPSFMEGVREVRRIDDERLLWREEQAGEEREWEALITGQATDKSIAWRSTTGPAHGGVVSFLSSGSGARVTLRIDYDPQEPGRDEEALARRIEGDLKRFKQLIEQPGAQGSPLQREVGVDRRRRGSSIGRKTAPDTAAPGKRPQVVVGGNTSALPGDSVSGEAGTGVGAEEDVEE
jgi:uncharacterized membrane protein